MSHTFIFRSFACRLFLMILLQAVCPLSVWAVQPGTVHWIGVSPVLVTQAEQYCFSAGGLAPDSSFADYKACMNPRIIKLEYEQALVQCKEADNKERSSCESEYAGYADFINAVNACVHQARRQCRAAARYHFYGYY